MNLTEFFSLFGYMLVCSFTPGPGNILALNGTSKYGWKDSQFLILGICIGYGIVQTICTITLSALSQTFSQFLQILKYVGGLYMLYLSIHIMTSRFNEESVDKKPTFREGLLLQLVNVKIYFYISTLLTVYFIPNCKSAFELIMAGAFAVSIGSIACLSWAFLGIKIQGLYRKYFKLVNMVLGVFLLYCVWTIIRR
ncbi:MAG: LysE family transporter [Lachnospirales bacterium]